MGIKINSQGGQVNLENSLKTKISELNKDVSSLDENKNEENKYTKENLNKSLDKLNKLLEEEETHAEYDVHEIMGNIMIKIVDNKTNEVIMECPPKKVIDLVAKLCELSGVLIDEEI